MVRPHPLLLLSLAGVATVSAHQEPKTDAEIETQRALQRAAYYCAPAVGEFTAQRKRAWEQQVLSGLPLNQAAFAPSLPSAGNPSLPTNDDLFASEAYADPTKTSASKQELLSCSVVEEETEIQNNTCVLTPIVTEGPYYHRSGHPIRQNIAEYQIGLLTYLDIGVIDVNTCQPLPNVLVDIWMANATGHYAGHPDPAPHLINEKPQVGGKRNGLLSAFPRTNFEDQWLRGAWATDSHGVARFTTIFPGYYTGRATHVHTKVFTSWTEHPNRTFDGGKLAHVGQFFFEDDLNVQIDKMYPYVENPIRDIRGRTRNWRDSLNIFEDMHGPEGEYNPVFKMHLLGGVLNQGLVGFITMGINASHEMDNWWKG